MRCEVTEHVNENLKLSDGNIWVWTLVSNIFICSYYDHGDGVQRASRGRGGGRTVCFHKNLMSVRPLHLIDLINLIFGVEDRAGKEIPIWREVYRNDSHCGFKIDMLYVHHQRQVPTHTHTHTHTHIYIYIYTHTHTHTKKEMRRTFL